MVSIAQIIESLAAAGVHAVAAVLDGIAERSTNPQEKKAYQRVCRAIYQQPSAQEIDDRYLLGRVDSLIREGVAKSEHDALSQVASTVARDERSLRSTIERLRRKRRKISSHSALSGTIPFAISHIETTED